MRPPMIRYSYPRPWVTKDEVKQIAELYCAGEKVEAIAKRYNRDRTTIQRAVRDAGVPRRPSGKRAKKRA